MSAALRSIGAAAVVALLVVWWLGSCYADVVTPYTWAEPVIADAESKG